MNGQTNLAKLQKKDNEMYENLAIRLDPTRSFLDATKYVNGATSIFMNQL